VGLLIYVDLGFIVLIVLLFCGEMIDIGFDFEDFDGNVGGFFLFYQVSLFVVKI
jgi:hypothetical protein